jgi:hypothetical protein
LPFCWQRRLRRKVGRITKTLLIVTAAAETATGLALLGLPSLVASVLLGALLDAPAALVVARVAGAALLALGVTCWLARNSAAAGLIAAMLLYNTAAVAVLAHAGAGLRLIGMGLWPAVALHVALAIWCIACLRTRGDSA